MKSKKPLVKIRTDATYGIGSGHAVRCISLVHMLMNDFIIHFFAMAIPDSLKNEITQNGWNVAIIEKETFFNY